MRTKRGVCGVRVEKCFSARLSAQFITLCAHTSLTNTQKQKAHMLHASAFTRRPHTAPDAADQHTTDRLPATRAPSPPSPRASISPRADT
eukprot:1668350-Prymnesium_polylepis.1